MAIIRGDLPPEGGSIRDSFNTGSGIGAVDYLRQYGIYGPEDALRVIRQYETLAGNRDRQGRLPVDSLAYCQATLSIAPSLSPPSLGISINSNKVLLLL